MSLIFILFNIAIKYRVLLNVSLVKLIFNATVNESDLKYMVDFCTCKCKSPTLFVVYFDGD